MTAPWRAVVACALALGASAVPALAAPVPAPVASARLEGTFQLAGRVTVARNVRGEHVGETVLRTWTFTSRCASGPCRTVKLVRNRAHGSDQLILHRRGSARYVGRGSFYAPLRCARHTWHRGAKVPFKIALRITAAVVSGGSDVATRIKATYTNRIRINMTPCVVVLGHDAAKYHGHVVPAPA